MQKLNVILTYLLLLVYGVSFGHQVLPHHHHEIDEHHNHHSVGTHDHCIDEKETHGHDHVAHEDHFDEGVIDFLACILGNHEHTPAGDCELTDAPNQQKNTVKDQEKTTATLVENPCVLEFISLEPQTEKSLFRSNFRSHFLAESISLRGPPMS